MERDILPKGEVVSTCSSTRSPQEVMARGGEGEIRTPEELSPLLAFQASALGHYATSPDVMNTNSRVLTLTNYLKQVKICPISFASCLSWQMLYVG